MASRPRTHLATGELTIKGITRKIIVPFNYLGESDTKHGKMVYAFEGEMTVNRIEYKIGGANLPFLSDDAKINFNVETKK